jgi:hypothetical protein
LASKAKPKKQIKQAQRTRRLIAQTFDALSDDRITANEILRDVPTCLKRMRVFDVLRRLNHMGGDGASKVLRHAKVWPVERMGRLTPEEREAIITHLPPRAKH